MVKMYTYHPGVNVLVTSFKQTALSIWLTEDHKIEAKSIEICNVINLRNYGIV